MNGILFQIASKAFKYNRTPLKLRTLALALFLQGLGIRRISKIIEKSKTAIHYWTIRFREALNYRAERKERRCIAIDETKIKVNDKWYFIYAAIDVDTRELVCIKAYTSRNYLTTLDSIKLVLRFCLNRDFEIITDKMPCYKQVCNRLGIKWKHVTFGERNRVEYVFRSFKFFTARFNNCLCVNLRKTSLIWDKNYWCKRVLYLLDLWCNMFMFYWNEWR